MTRPDEPQEPTGGGSGGGGGGEQPPPPDDGRDRLSPYLAIFRRMVRSLRSIFRAHLIVFKTEAHRELARIAVGAGLLFGVAVLLLACALLAGAGTVALVQRLTALPWLESIGIALLITLAVASVLGLFAWLRLRKPLMPESRKLLQDTIDGFTRG